MVLGIISLPSARPTNAESLELVRVTLCPLRIDKHRPHVNEANESRILQPCLEVV